MLLGFLNSLESISIDGISKISIIFEKIILEESGSNWNNLVDITVYLTDMKRDFDLYNEVYSEYFTSNQPCRTTVGITSLPTPIAIELKCIATVR